jgi:hypothetical protein
MRFAFVLLAPILAACASNVDVTHAYSPSEAAALKAASVEPVAIVRDGERIAVPPGSRVEAGRIVVPGGVPGQYVHKLGPNDVMEEDDQHRIIAVRTGSGKEIKFVPGTASSPADSDEVRGQLEGSGEAASPFTLREGDRVEMRGSFAPDAPVPGVGHVEAKSSEGLMVAGAVIFSLGYLPSAYFGIASHRSGDRVLLLPGLGPWLDFFTRPKCYPPAGSDQLPVDPCLDETASRVALIAGGVAQSFGALLFGLGLPGKSYLVHDQDRGVSVRVVPMTNAHGGGAAAIGTF